MGFGLYACSHPSLLSIVQALLNSGVEDDLWWSTGLCQMLASVVTLLSILYSPLFWEGRIEVSLLSSYLPYENQPSNNHRDETTTIEGRDGLLLP
jgi:hypothetical protein